MFGKMFVVTYNTFYLNKLFVINYENRDELIIIFLKMQL